MAIGAVGQRRGRRLWGSRAGLLLAGGGAAAAAGAAGLLRRSWASTPARRLFLRQAITVQKPADELYRLWRNPKMHARLEPRMTISAEADDGHWHWRRKLPNGLEIEWETEFTEERAAELLCWRSLRSEGRCSPPFQVRASLYFARVTPPPGLGGEATEVRLRLGLRAWDDAASRRLTARMAPLLRPVIERGVAARLFRFKQLAETGEIATVEGQPSGRRSALVRQLEPLDSPQSLVQRLRGAG